MNISDFFKKNHDESVESLEFFYFLAEILNLLLDQSEKTNNSLIINFVKALNGLCSWEFRKIENYVQSLNDSAFWESREFYRETMIKFVDGELNGLKFAQKFSDRLLAEKEIANQLVKNFKKQADIELDPESFKFSKIILNFTLVLEGYQNERYDFEIEDQVFEADLYFNEDSLREGVKVALEEINKYFKN